MKGRKPTEMEKILEKQGQIGSFFIENAICP